MSFTTHKFKRTLFYEETFSLSYQRNMGWEMVEYFRSLLFIISFYFECSTLSLSNNCRIFSSIQKHFICKHYYLFFCCTQKSSELFWEMVEYFCICDTFFLFRMYAAFFLFRMYEAFLFYFEYSTLISNMQRFSFIFRILNAM